MGHFSRIFWILCLLIPCTDGTGSIFKPLYFTTEPNDTVVLSEDLVILPCGALYGNVPPSLYSWERNGELLTFWAGQAENSRHILGNGSLYFSKIQAAGPSPDPGRYRCIAEVAIMGVGSVKTVHRIATPPIKLEIAQMNPFVMQPTSLRLRSGETAMFRCQVDSLPAATYTWTKGGRPLQTSPRLVYHSSGEVLEIRQVSAADEGQYRCKARSMSGERTSEAASLNIWEGSPWQTPPDFVMRPWDVTATEGQDATIFCAVNGSNSDGNPTTVTWLRDGSTVNTSGGSRLTIAGSGSLHITNVSRTDQGVYTCRGENIEDVTDAEATLTVNVRPHLVKRPKDTYGRLNEDVELECEIRGFPEPDVYWLKDSDPVEPSAYFQLVGRNLRIMGLMKTDAGYFQCVGVNTVGKVHAIAQLIVLEDDETMVPGTESSPTLATIVPTDGSLPPAPINLKAAIRSQTYVTLTWSSPLPPGMAPITAYTVTVTAKPGDRTNARTRAVNTTFTDYTVEGLLPDTEYTFQVLAYNRNGASMTHSQLTVSTQPEVAVPEIVSMLKVWAVSHESISVEWEPPIITNGIITQYRVYFYSSNQSLENYKVTTSRSILLDDLHPYTEYYIRVVALNANGPGSPTEERVVRTLSAKPSAAPTNVTLEVSSTTSILLRWTPPPAQSLNGQLTGFKIRYKAKLLTTGRANAHVTDADARMYEITGLDADTVYTVRIAALNINGTGEFTPWIEATTYREELDESVPPGKPLFIQTKTFAREMIVSWAPPDGDVLIRGYRLGYGTIAPDEEWVNDIPPSSRIYTLRQLMPLSNYVVQIVAYNEAGSSVAALQQDFTRVDQAPTVESELMPPLEVRVTVISATSAHVTWYDTTLGQNQKVLDDRVYTVQYNALSGSAHRRTQFINSTKPFVRVEGLRPYTRYEFSVMTTKGNRVSIYSLSARNITFEAAPSNSPEDLTITSIDSMPNHLMVSWQPPSRPNGRIITYTIYSNTNNQQPLSNWIVEHVPGHELNWEFGPVTSNTIYFFRIAAHNSKGASPPSNTEVFKTPNVAGLGGGTVDSGAGATDGDESTLLDQPAPIPTGLPPKSLPSAQTLWIIIACVSAITALAIAALVAVLCRRRILNERNKPVNLKAQNQAPKGMKGKQQPPDLWIDHEQVELKAIEKLEHRDVDERTSMLQSHSQFDVTSASLLGDHYQDEPRYSTLGHTRPVIIAPQPNRDAMPRAAVQPMNAELSRPLYPKTQFSSQNGYGSAPRVHVGDTSHPSSANDGYMGIETSSFSTDPVTDVVHNAPYNGMLPYYNGDNLEGYHSLHPAYSQHINGYPDDMYKQDAFYDEEEMAPPRPPPMENRVNPLRSFSIPAPPNNIPKHIVKPQPVSVFKPAPVPTEPKTSVDRNSLKRPPRPPYGRRLNSREDGLNKTVSTEQLNSEMANLDCIMKDLNSIRPDFEVA